MFPCLILLDHSNAKLLAVVSFKTPYDSCIKRLDKWGHIGFKEHKVNILWLILNIMTWEVVKCEADMLVLVAHFYVKVLDKSEGSCRSNLICCLLRQNNLLTLWTTQRSSKPSCCSDSKNHAQQDSAFWSSMAFWPYQYTLVVSTHFHPHYMQRTL